MDVDETVVQRWCLALMAMHGKPLRGSRASVASTHSYKSGVWKPRMDAFPSHVLSKAFDLSRYNVRGRNGSL